ncbi:MAG TPA: ABC transporter substrate-binding protein [Streptosporangiaceae bacterium]|jgi:ribose transport system substrate-binding protein|nr:ABC transporter substrate-binding protein [Streptosporangiaceae bacterium]
MSRRYPATITGVAAIAVVGLGLSACGSSNSGGGGGGGGGAAKKNLELVVGTKSDDFYVTMACGAQAEAKKLGVKLTVTGPADFSVSEQAPILNSVAASKPDALIVAPTDAKALNPELQRIQSAGTKIIFVDTSSSSTSLGVSRITTDNVGGGKLAADNLAQQIGGKGTVAVIDVNPGISTTDARIQGFTQEMKAKYPGITVLPTQYDNDSSATAASQVASDIAAHPNLSGVFATNVLSAQGAGTGVQHAGKSGKVKVATFDAEPQQMQMLKANSIQLAVAQDPYLEGQDAVQQALNAAEGKPVKANIGTPLVAITQKNMNDSSTQQYVYKSSC